MKNLSPLVKSIDIKIRQLALKYKTLQEYSAKLEAKLNQLETLNIQYKQTIQELQNQIEILTIAKSIPTGKDSLTAKKKINELLRELDKCIDLLNNKP